MDALACACCARRLNVLSSGLFVFVVIFEFSVEMS
jgi:hypothetical protein